MGLLLENKAFQHMSHAIHQSVDVQAPLASFLRPCVGHAMALDEGLRKVFGHEETGLRE